MGFLDKWSGKIGGWLYNATGAAQQWANQKEAMQNAHQWEVADLRKAGLNPILSAGGTGASTGGASGGTPVADVNPLSYFNSAISALSSLKNLDVMDSNMLKTSAEIGTIGEQGKYYEALTSQARSQARAIDVATAKDAMQLDYFRKHPDVYEVIQSGKAPGLVGQIMSGGMMLKGMSGGSNSAKAFKHYRYEDSR